MIGRTLAICCCVLACLVTPPARAQDSQANQPSNQAAKIIVRAGKADSLNHTLAQQYVKAALGVMNGAYAFDLQESQGSIQNVIEAPAAPDGYIFTASGNVIADARRGKTPFKPNRHYRDIRALFPIPAQTVHWVVRQDSGIKTLAEVAGGSFITGSKGSIAERVTAEAFEALGIDKRVQVMDLDAAAAPAALKAKQLTGFAVAGPFPLPALSDLAKSVSIRILSLPPKALHKMLAADDSLAALTVPKGVYGATDDVTVLSLPAGMYTTSRLANATAYALTKAFWAEHDVMAKDNPAWSAMSAQTLASLGVRLHPGALYYYREVGMAVPKTLR